MDGAQQRAELRSLIADSGTSLDALSRLLGRNPSYLQQYLMRGSPRLLAERDRAALAQFFGVAEARLGGPDRAMVAVPRAMLGASAGAGRVIDDEAARARLLDPALLRRLGVAERDAAMIAVEGNSMEPELVAGDELLIDRARRAIGARPALCVARIEGLLMVKRLASDRGGVAVLSDNPAYPPRHAAAADVEVIGRVVWLSRAL